MQNIFADVGIALCRNIEKLYATNNPKIKTCASFAKSLKLLSAAGCCGINDAGIAACHSIGELFAANNPKITTREPFATSLKRLRAVGVCGINDNGIALCCVLEYLDASNNPTIATRAPFAGSLMCLYAMHDKSGIDTDGYVGLLSGFVRRIMIRWIVVTLLWLMFGRGDDGV